jgi:hypothetical protein
LIDGPTLSEPDPQTDPKDDSWKKPLLLMILFTVVPVVIIAVAYAVHSLS